jgi:hypothetical protein
MKAKLIFNLENIDDQVAFERCSRSLDMALALFDFSNKLRSIEKHGSGEEDIAQEFYNILEKYSLNIDKLVN